MAAALVAVLAPAGCGDEDQPAAAGSRERTISHAMGSTKVPAAPRRVVVLDTGELDSAVALGVKPVGAVEAIAGAGFPEYLASQVEGVAKVGTIEQPNLEAIAALRPDLILSSKVRHEAIYDQLSRIAPTIFSEEVGVTWKENFALHAEALGKAGGGGSSRRSTPARPSNSGMRLVTSSTTPARRWCGRSGTRSGST
jgi:iron complex transport system substrate-binding protein